MASKQNAASAAGSGRAAVRGEGVDRPVSYPWWAPTIIFVAVLIVFDAVRKHDFVLDSTAIVSQNAAVNASDWKRIATTDWWDGAPAMGEVRGGLYRPVAKLWLAALYQGWSHRASGINLMAMALHAIVAWLRFTIFRRLLRGVARGDILALLAALAAGLHPVAVEVVGCQVGTADLLAAALTTGALIVADGPRSMLRYGAAAVLAMLGVWSKESAVAVVPLSIMYAGMRAQAGERRGAMVAALCWSAAGVAVALAVRVSVLGGLGAAEPVYAGFPPLARLASACATLATNTLPLLVAPFSQIPVVTHQDVLPAAGFGDPRAGAGAMLLLATLAGGALAWVRGARGVAFGIAWFLVSWFPTSNLAFSTGAIAASRFLYVPVAGLLFALVVGTAPLLQDRRWWLRGVPILAGVWILGVLPAATYSQRDDWTSETSLYESVIARHPNQAHAAKNLAQFVMAPDPDRARRLYQAVMDGPDPHIPGTDFPPEDVLILKYQAAMNAANLAVLQANDHGAARVAFDRAAAFAAIGEVAARVLPYVGNWRAQNATARREFAKLLLRRAATAGEPERSALIADARQRNLDANGLDANTPTYYWIQAMLSELERKPDDARSWVQQGRAKHPDDPALKLQAANVLRRDKKEAEAVHLEVEAMDVLTGGGQADPAFAVQVAKAAVALKDPRLTAAIGRILQYVVVRGSGSPALAGAVAEARQLLASEPPPLVR